MIAKRYTKATKSLFIKAVLIFILILAGSSSVVWARLGGGGGGGHSGGYSGGHSSYSGSHSYGSSNNGGSSGGGGGIGVFLVVGFIVLIVIVAAAKSKRNKSPVLTGSSMPFPDGLTEDKVKTSFFALQNAWQNKDMKQVRQWITDGSYQRFTTQFEIMKKLDQVNRLSNIRLNGLKVVKQATDAGYNTVDVAISSTMNDEFISQQNPSFNEKFNDDSAIEYWTFIKKGDAKASTDIYSTSNCPNCGAPMDIKLGEICRCSSCGTLANNAAYDWVLSTITEEEDYVVDNRISRMEALKLYILMKNDSQFSIQRIEDIASNVFMQVMQAVTMGESKRPTRFADEATAAKIREVGKANGILFNRLYLNNVVLMDFVVNDNRLDLMIEIDATYQRVIAGEQLQLLDKDAIENRFTIVLSKNVAALNTPAKETVYSYECPSCGAPIADTADAVCTYCGHEIVNLNQNWVLTAFNFPAGMLNVNRETSSAAVLTN